MRNRNVVLTLLVLPALALGAAACGGKSSSSGGGGGKLSLVAYSTPKEAYKEIVPAFDKTPDGKGVSFTQSYGASGDQSRAVQSGLPADVVALSLAPDVTKLVKKNLVAKDWNQDRYKGFVTNSVVVLAVRKGNPKHIGGWADIVKPGVEVITPNPFTSGGARWNIMAAYGAQLQQGKTPAQALAFVGEVLKHTPVQDKSARESLQTFAGGKGDVLIAYENEAITAQQKGEAVDYVIPPQTILIENPIAVVSTSKNPAKAKAFVAFTRTPEAQRIFAAKGYRSVLPAVLDAKRYPQPAGLFTIEKFGGWSKVTDEFFDPDKGRIAGIEKGLGVSTSK
ncbi:MAG: sulfate/thiosulfate transport system substrate-binding protein [Solirubrobacteraceae bacterium]|nr:sulfate/thiosulfate transport system substrate-binding protein [Solirubrobacteraceae bacterium]